MIIWCSEQHHERTTFLIGAVRVLGEPLARPALHEPELQNLRRLFPVACHHSSEVGAFYWTVSPPDIVNSGREEQGLASV